MQSIIVYQSGAFLKQCDQNLEKISPIYWKVAKTIDEPKNAKISLAKLNWKARIIYMKPLLKT
jgi:hypothetical protein